MYLVRRESKQHQYSSGQVAGADAERIRFDLPGEKIMAGQVPTASTCT